MLRIGDFSKLSHLTAKALRFYEKEGLLIPAYIDEITGYRFYDTSQLEESAKIKAYRQLGLTIEEIKAIQSGADKKLILAGKAELLRVQKEDIDTRLSIIRHMLEEPEDRYQVTVKDIPSAIVYYTEILVKDYSEISGEVIKTKEEFRKMNPSIKFVEPRYEFCEYLDEEHKEKNAKIRYNEAVESIGACSSKIKYREVPALRVLSTYHKGSYENMIDAYVYMLKYAEENGYKITDYYRESYIDGVWNKDSEDEWLTEIQIPIEVID